MYEKTRDSPPVFVLFTSFLDFQFYFSFYSKSPWSYTCENGPDGPRCIKILTPNDANITTNDLMSCKMTCHDSGLIWPKPTEKLNLSKTLINCLPGDISITLPRTKESSLIGKVPILKEIPMP